MMKMFYNKIINRFVCVLLVAVFLSSFPTGTTTLAFCLDEQENHVVGQNLFLVDCHSSIEIGRIYSAEHFQALVEKRGNDCTDVSLTNATILNRPSRITLPVLAKVFLSYTLPREINSYQQQVAKQSLSALSQPLFVLPHIDTHRTVVLLI
jgi:hypothetical protein